MECWCARLPLIDFNEYLDALLQVVLKKSYNYSEIGDSVHNKITEFAGRGFRALGVATAPDDGTEGETATKCAFKLFFSFLSNQMQLLLPESALCKLKGAAHTCRSHVMCNSE